MFPPGLATMISGRNLLWALRKSVAKGFRKLLFLRSDPSSKPARPGFSLFDRPLGWVLKLGRRKKKPSRKKSAFNEEIRIILASDLFSTDQYAASASIEFATREEACAHYCNYGWRCGYNPSSGFNTNFYLASNPDVRRASINPLAHYLRQGSREGRSPVAPSFKQESQYQARFDHQFVEWNRPRGSACEEMPKVIAFYLPQFHRIAENDQWWGEGFTEWTNVKKAVPLFPGHHQPHIPGDLGYYDLASVNTLARQAKIASAYGIHGFCFYFYWFSGKTLLEKPLDLILKSPDLAINYCLCWANENWTRAWDGLDRDILIAQKHSPRDDIEFISHIRKYLSDSRYIRVDGKPLLIVYRPSLLPDPLATARRWRNWCIANGIGEIVLATTQSFEKMDPRSIGFDLAIEFSPNGMNPRKLNPESLGIGADFEGSIYDWSSLIERSRDYRDPGYPIARCINPGWDNSPRKGARANILVGNSPRRFVEYMENAFCYAADSGGLANFVFVNAWNEWAEGAFLEPSSRLGYAFLDALRQGKANALSQINRRKENPGRHPLLAALIVHAYYPELLPEVFEYCRSDSSDFIFDRIIITTSSAKLSQCRQIIADYSLANAFVFALENRGRDIRPFLESLLQIHRSGIEIICKIHTKKSSHRQDGDDWRKAIYESLFHPSALRAIRGLGDEGSRHIGLLAPAGHLLPMGTYWGRNEDVVLALGTRLGFSVSEIANAPFPAGSMFWARTNALAPIIALADCDKFQCESGQIDGTYAHALERVFSLVVKRAGYVSVELDPASPCGYVEYEGESGNLFRYNG